MKDITKLDDIECMREDCGQEAVVRIKTSEGTPLELCVDHRDKFADKMREKIQDKFEGMNEDEIAEKLVNEGEFLL